MKYDPKNPLSEKELDKLGKEDFDGFLEYIDGMDVLRNKKKNFKKKLSEFKEKREMFSETLVSIK